MGNIQSCIQSNYRHLQAMHVQNLKRLSYIVIYRNRVLLICKRSTHHSCRLLAPMPPTPLGVLGATHMAIPLGILTRRLAIRAPDLTVLHPGAHPLLQMSVELTPRHTALATVHLSLHAHVLQLRSRIHGHGRLRPAQRPRAAPGPFHVVGAGVPRG